MTRAFAECSPNQSNLQKLGSPSVWQFLFGSNEKPSIHVRTRNTFVNTHTYKTIHGTHTLTHTHTHSHTHTHLHTLSHTHTHIHTLRHTHT